MPRGMLDYMMMSRDGKNPYGARGGYIAHRDPRRRDRRRDYAMEEYRRGDRNMEDYPRYDDRERPSRYGDSAHSEYDYARGGRGYERTGQYDRGSVYPFNVSGTFGRYDACYEDPYMDEEWMMYDMASRGRGRYDRGMSEDYLTDRELDHWMKKLMAEVEEKDKPMLKMESVLKKAKDMGIQFDKFSEEEFHTTVLMVFTDYCKTLGTTNIDQYVRLAKDWLCDEDSELKYGEKLGAYFHFIIEGE